MFNSTNLANGAMVDGVPLTSSIIPPITGTYFHVCPGSTTITNTLGKQVVGSSGNDGLSVYSPLDSIATAYTKCTSGAGDGIILWSYGTSTAMTSSYLTSSLTWSKHGITVVGMCAPVMSSQRARVTNASTALTLTSLMTVSGNNNTFINVQLANFGTDATALGGVIVTGYRNAFINCDIVGAGADTPSQTAGAYSLYLNGAQECLFRNCVIGLDTVTASGSNINGVIQFGGGCQSNVFDACLVRSSYTTSTSTNGSILHVGSGDSITRHQYFRNCIFSNYKTGTITTSPPGAVVVGTAPNNGDLVFHNCVAVGFTAWAASGSRVQVGMPTSTASGAGGLATTI